MIDQEKWIASQAIMKALIEKSPSIAGVSFAEDFKRIMAIMEDYATLSEEDEFINTEIGIPKQFWNQDPKAQTSWLTEWGKPLPIVNKVGRKEWFVHCKRKDMAKLKKEFDQREENFQSMVNKHEEVKI